jgi:hypothetical protein
MRMVIELDPESMHQMVVSSLMEFHTCLARANWEPHDDERLVLVNAFEIVLQEYLTDEEFYEYNREVKSCTH